MHHARRPQPAPRKGCFVWRMTKKLVKFAAVSAFVTAVGGFFGLPMLAKTDWARARVERTATEMVGSPVHVGSMTLSWRTGLRLADVIVDGSLEAPDTPAAIREIVVTLNRTVIRGADVAINTPVETGVPAVPTCCRRICLPTHEVVIEGGSLAVDGAVVSDLCARIEVRKRKDAVTVMISDASAKVNGGSVSGSAELISRDGLSGKVVIDASRVGMTDRLARLLAAYVPAFAGARAEGVVDVRATLEGSCEKPTGRAEIAFDGRLSGAGMMQALGAATQDSRVGSMDLTRVAAHLQIEDGRATHVGTELRNADGAARMTGWVDRAGSLDVVVTFDHAMVHAYGGKAEAELLEGVRLVGYSGSPQALLD